MLQRRISLERTEPPDVAQPLVDFSNRLAVVNQLAADYAKEPVAEKEIEKQKKSDAGNKEFYKNMFSGSQKVNVKCTPNKQAQQTKKVYADLGHPDVRDGTVLWTADQSHQDLHDVINRLAAKPADEVSKEDIQEANELRYHHAHMENAEAARTNSQWQPMTTEEKTAKQALVEEMLGTWKSARAEDADSSSKVDKTVGIDDTWTIDGKHLIVEPNKTSDTYVAQ